MPIEIIYLPYFCDSAVIFEKVLDLPWPIFLDSTKANMIQNRFDIISANPTIKITTHDNQTVIANKNITKTSFEDPFLIVKKYLNIPLKNPDNLPFIGGAMGYFSYDLNRQIEKLPNLAKKDNLLPEMKIGIYDWGVVVDHSLKRTSLVIANRFKDTKDFIKIILERLRNSHVMSHQAFKLTSEFSTNLTKNTYSEVFFKIKQHICEGDCYQVNIAQRFSATFSGSTWLLYKKLRTLNPAPFSAYLSYPEGDILSCSPERFLNVVANVVETKPIKGTRKRALTDPEIDQRLAMELLHSSKDQAENLMIVDLLRNDLGKNCRAGSIKVPKLFALESYTSVHHLVSTITGELDSRKHVLDLLRDCFPGGSITGAPKYRAMQLIESYEPHRRNVYCGSIGYISFDGRMDTNIAIRTLICCANRLYCAAGGGVVADSDLDAEYEETLAKVSSMINILKLP